MIEYGESIDDMPYDERDYGIEEIEPVDPTDSYFDDITEEDYAEAERQGREAIALGRCPPFDFCYYCKNECKGKVRNMLQANDCHEMKFVNWNDHSTEIINGKVTILNPGHKLPTEYYWPLGIGIKR